MSPACYAELMSLRSKWGCCLRAAGAEVFHCMQRAEAAHLAASMPPGQPMVACFLDAVGPPQLFSQLKAKMPPPATSQRVHRQVLANPVAGQIALPSPALQVNAEPLCCRRLHFQAQWH